MGWPYKTKTHPEPLWQGAHTKWSWADIAQKCSNGCLPGPDEIDPVAHHQKAESTLSCRASSGQRNSKQIVEIVAEDCVSPSRIEVRARRRRHTVEVSRTVHTCSSTRMSCHGNVTPCHLYQRRYLKRASRCSCRCSDGCRNVSCNRFILATVETTQRLSCAEE